MNVKVKHIHLSLTHTQAQTGSYKAVTDKRQQTVYVCVGGCVCLHAHTCIHVSLSVCKEVLIRQKRGGTANPKSKRAHLRDPRVPRYDWRVSFHWRCRTGDGLWLSRPKGPLWFHVFQLLHHAPLSTTKEGPLWVCLCIGVMWCAWHGCAWPSVLIVWSVKIAGCYHLVKSFFLFVFFNLFYLHTNPLFTSPSIIASSTTIPTCASIRGPIHPN